MAVSYSTVLRVRGLPSNRNIDEVTSLLEHSLQIRPKDFGLKITSLADDPYQVKKQVATLMFLKNLPPLFTTSTTNQWSIKVPETDYSSKSDGDQALTFDTHFHGLTALNTPRSKEEAVNCVAVCGLGGHAFGSFKEKGTSYMWLRDSLPRDLPNLRVFLYGYESGLDGSDSHQNVSVIADSFVGHLSELCPQSKPISTPLVIIAHSLGGLVVKQAIMKLGRGNEQDKKQMESVVGLLFFGVPNRGMDIESLQAIVGDRQNRYLLESVGQYSDLLLEQDRQFGSTFHFKDSRVISFFETKSSPTAIKVYDSWKMAGPKKVLVTQYSATRPRLWDSDDEGFNRTHSDLVKFSVNDVDYARVLSRLRGIVTEATAILTSRYLAQGSSRTVKPLFMVPFTKDPKFIDRVEIFKNIEERTKTQSRVALSGTGGVGKSQIAIEYCYRFREAHPHAHVIWVHSSTAQRLNQAYRDIARTLTLPGWNDPKVDTLRSVFEWFNEADNGQWLMVLDNADNLDTFFAKPTSTVANSEHTMPFIAYLPQSSRGLMLITTRDSRMGGRLADRHTPIAVDPMSPSEAQDLLRSQSKRPDSGNDDDSRILVDALEYIPLAITQAAAFISENNLALVEYLEMLRTDDSDLQDLLDEDLGDLRRDSESQNSVLRTWKLSFDLISNQKPRAAEMLSLMAVLDRQGIPKSLLRNDADRNIDVVTALGILQAFSLISAEDSGSGYELHRLVQLATRKWLEIQGTKEEWQEKALLMLADMFPAGDFESWTTCESLLPHAQTVTQYENANEACPEQFAHLSRNMAHFDMLQGRYEIAHTRSLAAFEVQEKISGLEHPDTLTSMANLALTYQNQGRWDEAEKLDVQVMEMRKRVLKEEHPDTLTSMSNLASTYRNQGRWDEAEKLEVQVMNMSLRVLKEEHPDTLTSMANLALTYRNQGRWKEAIELIKVVVNLRTKTIGANHPDTLNAVALLDEWLST